MHICPDLAKLSQGQLNAVQANHPSLIHPACKP